MKGCTQIMCSLPCCKSPPVVQDLDYDKELYSYLNDVISYYRSDPGISNFLQFFHTRLESIVSHCNCLNSSIRCQYEMLCSVTLFKRVLMEEYISPLPNSLPRELYSILKRVGRNHNWDMLSLNDQIRDIVLEFQKIVLEYSVF